MVNSSPPSIECFPAPHDGPSSGRPAPDAPVAFLHHALRFSIGSALSELQWFRTGRIEPRTGSRQRFRNRVAFVSPFSEYRALRHPVNVSTPCGRRIVGKPTVHVAVPAGQILVEVAPTGWHPLPAVPTIHLYPIGRRMKSLADSEVAVAIAIAFRWIIMIGDELWFTIAIHVTEFSGRARILPVMIEFPKSSLCRISINKCSNRAFNRIVERDNQRTPSQAFQKRPAKNIGLATAYVVYSLRTHRVSLHLKHDQMLMTAW